MSQPGKKAGAQVYRLINYKETGELLRMARMEKGESGMEVASKAGMNQSQVSKLERGEQIFYTAPIKERLERLAKHLGVEGLQFESVDNAQVVKPKRKSKKAPKQRVASPDALGTLRALLDGHKRGQLSEDEFLKLVVLIASSATVSHDA